MGAGTNIESWLTAILLPNVSHPNLHNKNEIL